MPATIRDVKEKTGLSLATISKYLHGGNVLPENRVLIEKAIKELNYEVNEIARGLVTHQTKTIGIIVYDISSFFSSNVLHYLGQELKKNGYAMMICDSCNSEEQEAENVKFLLNRKVDGLIVLPVSLSGQFLEPAKKADIPVVLLDRSFEDEEFDCVCLDNRVATFRAMNILIQNNHRDIAFIGSDVAATGIERFKGYRDALQQAGIEEKKEYQMLGTFSVEYGYEMMNKILKMEVRPTAVFLSNYETALGAVMALNESDYNCPDDISLFGFDNLLISGIVKPSLWLVEQPMQLLCSNAVEMLLKRVSKESDAEPVKHSFGAKIRSGASVRKIERTVSL